MKLKMKLKMKLRKEKGFTLIEMVTVLLLMGLLLSMAMPTIQQTYVQFQMDAAILRLHNDIRWAQRLADQEQKRVSIMFFRDRQPYRYVIRVAGDTAYLRKVELPDNLTGVSMATILIEADKKFQKNGHVMIQKGEISRYVYYYQTGRCRVSAEG